MADPRFVQIFFRIRFEKQGDIAAGFRFAGWGDGKARFAIAGPAKRIIAGCFFRHDLNPLGHHKGGIESNAKLADKLALRFCRVTRFVHLLKKRLGTRTSNRAKCFFQIIRIKPDAIVADGDAFRFFINRDRDHPVKRASRLALQ